MSGRTPVDSSNIETVHINDGGLLEVTFRSRPDLVYEYEGTGVHHLHALLNAQSAGRWFNENIRSRPDIHPYRILPREESTDGEDP